MEKFDLKEKKISAVIENIVASIIGAMLAILFPIGIVYVFGYVEEVIVSNNIKNFKKDDGIICDDKLILKKDGWKIQGAHLINEQTKKVIELDKLNCKKI